MNDSFEDEQPFVSRDQAICIALEKGATHVLICTDHDETVPQEAVYVMPGECVGKIEKACWRSSFNVDTIDVDEIRRNGAME